MAIIVDQMKDLTHVFFLRHGRLHSQSRKLYMCYDVPCRDTQAVCRFRCVCKTV